MNHRVLPTALLFAAFAFSLHAEPAALKEIPFSAVTNPPPIQMLMPGFTVRELPLELNNINSFAYAPDGRLLALGYDGNIFELKDTDGDGLPDTATLFFKNEHNEIPASIGMAWGPGGLYVASQTRVIRVKDTGDGTGALETVTGNWVKPTGTAGSGLDAVGLAIDTNGNIFFGLGTDDWQHAYRVDEKTGKSLYNVHSERGTIQKLSPDWKHRETIATGVRFTVCMAFNTNGDLFCTDQEGATWLPNGNPFDELLNIQPGRHYGFPPRHPKYLPDVIDEPSVFDYAPQHQSTCGIHFDEPTAGGTKIFGPDWWRGDAFIAGESRGKIWRTKLVKTPDDYVAQNQLIACLKMLTIDAIPTPDGGLLVTCHGGHPDWGSGPQGKGKLFKITCADAAAPQPVLAYAASPTETRVVFDRPIDPAQFKNLAKQSSITMGRYVTAGERFESFRPGYQAVVDQQQIKRYDLPILSAAISGDNRSIIFQTLPRVTAMNYAVKMPEGSKTERAFNPDKREQPQFAAIDVMGDLTGVEAIWRGKINKTNTTWTAWLPHLDLNVSRGFTAASAEHDKFFELIKLPGTLTLRAQLDLDLMLHPKIQPGAKLDYQYPPEVVTVILKSRERLKVKSNANIKRINSHEFRITLTPTQNHWLPLEITLHTGGEPDLQVSWFTDEDPRPRAFPLRRILMPFAQPETPEPLSFGPRVVAAIAGGDWERGKKVFFGEQVGCYKCHQVGGEGGRIGPDLSNLVYRDYASVYKDITEPSAAINPDHIAYNVQLKDGDTVTGVVMEDTTEHVVLGQATGQNLTVEKSKIAGMKASSLSLMPEGLLQPLSTQQQRDLFTFLLMTKPTK
jgi:putative heme-binding domain-containing protein